MILIVGATGPLGRHVTRLLVAQGQAVRVMTRDPDRADALRAAGSGHFIFTSVLGASPSHPADFWRTKARIERYLVASGIPYTIIRPSAFMEVHAYQLIGKAVLTGKPVMLFGPGDNPKNFVAAAAVAALVVRALDDARLRGETIEIGGPDSHTSRQVVAVFERVAGKTARANVGR